MVTHDQLLAIMPYAKQRIEAFLVPLNAAMDEFGINTIMRQAAFLAQVGHESGQLQYVCELASGKAYECRADLGNSMPGDGVKYKGRGLIQITGKSNYMACMMALDIDCVEHPWMLETPPNACRSAGWFWKTHGLNELSDQGNFLGVSGVINCGRAAVSPQNINGFADRVALYEKAKNILSKGTSHD